MTTVALPWYREFWPWFIIGLLGSCVVACMLTLAIALRNPDYLVVDESTFQSVKADLRGDRNDASDGAD